ncbi:Rtf2 domain-containing protein [Mycena indigotica]|uniref:Rtf2 domain-containing protein n=1 Tax=Mycena indigotica TaxID=2126181 RepID=A0A8H6SAL7_9AGAR|nr:Rtf2 domain-containing protein [Mycena indigotica]KAF7295196.1 Rtf2 domain-containing protein [Mycena indigotica]
MGNDGGSIPDRRDLVRSKKKAEAVDKANQTRARWGFCALSKRRLQEPVVSCALGKLYNKDAIIEFLLNRDAYGDGENICGHIRSLKDVKTLVLTPNSAPAASGTDPTERTLFVCPLTYKEMNGLTPFVYLRTCGCVFAAAGLNAVRSSPPESQGEPEKDTCPNCATKFTHSIDCIPLNPSADEEERLRELMAAQRLVEPVKKSKKRKAAAADITSEPVAKKSAVPTISTASNSLRSTLALEEAKRKANMSDAVKTLYSSQELGRKETFMTRGTFTRYA